MDLDPAEATAHQSVTLDEPERFCE